jgi:hypothetical protein
MNGSTLAIGSGTGSQAARLAAIPMSAAAPRRPAADRGRRKVDSDVDIGFEVAVRLRGRFVAQPDGRFWRS